MKHGLFWIVIASLYLPFATALTITLPSQAALNTPTTLNWTLDPSDPPQWDFRFVQNGQDVGLAVANVKSDGKQAGQVDVIFPGSGDFAIVAVAGANHDVIGQSLITQVVNSVPSPSSSLTSSICTPSVSITTVLTSSTSLPSSSSSKKPHVNVPAIVGGIIGAVALAFLLLISFLLVRRRRRNQSDIPAPPMQEAPQSQRRSWMKRLTLTAPPLPFPISPRAGTGGPKGPRAATKIAPLPRTIIVRPPRTERQLMLDERVAELLEEIGELQQRGVKWRDSGVGERVDEIRVRIRRLRDMKDGPWAMGETDEVPVGLEIADGTL